MWSALDAESVFMILDSINSWCCYLHNLVGKSTNLARLRVSKVEAKTILTLLDCWSSLRSNFEDFWSLRYSLLNTVEAVATQTQQYNTSYLKGWTWAPEG